MKQKHVWKNLSRCMRVIVILALVFLAVGLGTLGSVRSLGGSYRLAVKRGGDGKQPAVTLHITEPGHGEQDHEHKDLYIKSIFVNVGTIYAKEGESATLQIGRGVSSSSDFFSAIDVTYLNLPRVEKEDGVDEVTYANDALFNWVSAPVPEKGWRLATYPYFQFRAVGHDLLLNEVVFVAAEKPASDSAEFIGKEVLLKAEIFPSASNLPKQAGETDEQAIKAASAIVDSQFIPSMAQSSYFRFGTEEAAVLSTVAEMRQNLYFSDNAYPIASEYNSFGLDLVALGTAVFGMSPFGLRFLPFLATFGAFVFGALLARKMLKSERAGLIFAALFLLSGIPVSLGHFGASVMIGVFFTIASLFFCYRFFADGMRSGKLSAAVPVLLSALFAACAVCTQGAFLIPVLGIAGLFAAGVVRQRRRCRAELDAAIEQAEKAQSAGEESAAGQGMQKVAKVVNETRSKQTAAIAVFSAVFLLGALLIGVLSALPLYTVYGKAYGDGVPRNIFTYLWKSFIGGFAGSSVSGAPAVWNPFYPVFRGTGELYAVTSAGFLVAVVPILIGLAGLVYAIVRFAKGRENFGDAFANLMILLAGFVLSVVTASFAGGGVGFLFLSYLFLFLFAARLGADLYDGDPALYSDNGEASSAVNPKKWLVWLGFAVSALCFAVFAAFVFSIPLPAALMNVFFR